MFDRISKFAGRKAVVATAAVLALSTVASTPSFAGGRHWHHGGGAAAAAIAGIVGTGLAIAAAQNRAAYAYDYGGPAYYSGPAYGYGPYYGPGPDYQYQRYGGTSPAEACGQGYWTNCY
jgi:hypothetical protein